MRRSTSLIFPADAGNVRPVTDHGEGSVTGTTPICAGRAAARQDFEPGDAVGLSGLFGQPRGVDGTSDIYIEDEHGHGETTRTHRRVV